MTWDIAALEIKKQINKMTITDYYDVDGLVKKAREREILERFKTRNETVCPYLDTCLLATWGISVLEAFCMNYRYCPQKLKRDKFKLS